MVRWNKKWLQGPVRNKHKNIASLPSVQLQRANTQTKVIWIVKPFLVQLTTMSNTILITSHWSLQVLKVLCKWQHEETKVFMLGITRCRGCFDTQHCIYGLWFGLLVQKPVINRSRNPSKRPVVTPLERDLGSLCGWSDEGSLRKWIWISIQCEHAALEEQQ